MYCPNCGIRVSTEQKFCRACGLGVQAIAQLFAQQLAENPGVSPAERAISQTSRPDQPSPCNRAYWFIFVGVCVFLLGPMFFVITKALNLDRLIFLPATFFVCIGTLISLYGALMQKLHAPKMISSLPQPSELTVADTTSKLALASGAEPVSSVVEHTTRHLNPVKAKSGDLS